MRLLRNYTHERGTAVRFSLRLLAEAVGIRVYLDSERIYHIELGLYRFDAPLDCWTIYSYIQYWELFYVLCM